MANHLTDKEIEEYEAQLVVLEEKLESSKITAASVANSQDSADRDEKVAKKDWNYFHRIITTYEKEVEILTGKYIQAPLSEKDLKEHVENKGRLLQLTKSLDPLKIREMIGLGFAAAPRFNREDRHISEIPVHADLIVTGYGPNNSPTSTLDADFKAGDGFVLAVTALTPNLWYLLQDRVFVKLGASTTLIGGTCDTGDPADDTQSKCINSGGNWTPFPPSYRHEVLDRLPFPGAEIDLQQGDSIGLFNGFTNTERLAKIATLLVRQPFFDILITQQTYLVGKWKALVTSQIGQQDRLIVDDPDFDETAKTTNLTQLSYIDGYISNGYPLEDGVSGIDGLTSQVAARTAYIPTRVPQAKAGAAVYYNDRIQLTNTRANRQAGTLFRTQFVGGLSEGFPLSGDPNIISQIGRIKRRLADI